MPPQIACTLLISCIMSESRSCADRYELGMGTGNWGSESGKGDCSSRDACEIMDYRFALTLTPVVLYLIGG